MNKLIRLTESDLHRIVKESVNRILDEGWSSYVDYYYPDNEKEPSKSSRVRRREYMRKKQENVEESTIMRLTESDLHKIVKESVGKILKETSDNFDSNLDEGVYLSAGWLSDILEAIDKEERSVSMNGQQPQLRAEGMRMALEIIKDHI